MKTFAAALIAVVVNAKSHGSDDYVNRSAVCIGLKQKRNDSLSGGNWSKYSYYATYYADNCLIEDYAGQKVCAPIHADANQALANNHYDSYN